MYIPTRARPGSNAPANKSPTETGSGEKFPTVRWAST